MKILAKGRVLACGAVIILFLASVTSAKRRTGGIYYPKGKKARESATQKGGNTVALEPSSEDNIVHSGSTAPLEKPESIETDLVVTLEPFSTHDIIQKTGGWSDVPVGDIPIDSVKQSMSSLLNKFSKDQIDDAAFDILRVRRQIASGTNYKVCAVTTTSTPETFFEVTYNVALGKTLGKDASVETDVRLLDVRGKHVSPHFGKFYDRGSKVDVAFRCTESDGEEYEPLPTIDVSSGSTSQNPRFLRRASKLWTAQSMTIDPPPPQFDWRTEYAGQCRSQIEQTYDQGLCGSCYAHAAVSASADRACIAAAKAETPLTSLLRLSVQDVVSCGTHSHGRICVREAAYEGKTSTRFANHCDGGHPLKIYEYASTGGLKEESCHAFDPSLSSARPSDPNFGQSRTCSIFRQSPFFAGKIGCAHRFLTVDTPADATKSSSRIDLEDLDFCKCAPQDRWHEVEGKSRVNTWDPTRFDVRMMYSGPAICIVTLAPGTVEIPSPEDIEIGCQTTEYFAKPGITFKPFSKLKGTLTTDTAISLGPLSEISEDGTKRETAAMHLCRCPAEDRLGEGWTKVTVREQGDGALRSKCKKPYDAACAKTYMFSNPTAATPGVDAMQRSILFGGPVTASIDILSGKTLEKHDDGRGGNVYVCSGEGTRKIGSHTVVIFGWGTTDAGIDFWWARNTWGDSWPANALHKGIFKIKRGSNECSIESTSATFSLVKSIPDKDVEKVEGAFLATKKCEKLRPAESGAFECLSVTNEDTGVQIRNTCDEKSIEISESIINGLATHDERKNCGSSFSSIIVPPQASKRYDLFSGFCALRATFLEDAPLPPASTLKLSNTAKTLKSCMTLKIAMQCTVRNQCTSDLILKFRSPTTVTQITTPVVSGTESSIPIELCDLEMETYTLPDETPVDAKACCFKSEKQSCMITNTCPNSMKLQRIDGRSIYSMAVPNDGKPHFIEDAFCTETAEVSAITIE